MKFMFIFFVILVLVVGVGLLYITQHQSPQDPNEMVKPIITLTYVGEPIEKGEAIEDPIFYKDWVVDWEVGW